MNNFKIFKSNKARHILFQLIFFCSITSHSQQVNIGHIQNYTRHEFSSTYNSKFVTVNTGPVLFDRNTTFYHSNKIKQVEVTTKNGAIIWGLQLDTAGNILSTEFRGGGFYVKIEELISKKDRKVRVLTYYNDHYYPVRIDSISIYNRYYENNDTLMEYSCTVKQVFKVGYLMNDQNRYYNSNYLNKKVDPDHSFQYSDMTIAHFDDTPIDTNKYEPPVYLKTSFKTNYDSLKMYYCLFESSVGEIYTYSKSTRKSLEVDLQAQHPFVINRNLDDFKHCYQDAECFVEPVFSTPSTLSIDHTNYEYNNGHKKGYYYDQNGLKTEYYLEYYPEDTAATRIAKMKSENSISNEDTDLDHYAYRYTVRQKTPIRLTTYYFRYKYFD